MKHVLIVLGFLVLGSGAAVLLAEVRAFWQVDDKPAAFENGDGFAVQLRMQRLVRALGAGDGQKVGDVVTDQLARAPFDPVLLSLKAINLAPVELGVSAGLLDQAQSIAPRDPRVRALRLAAQSRLQNLRLSESKWAE